MFRYFSGSRRGRTAARLRPILVLAAGLVLGFAVMAPGPASAGSDRDYRQRIERESQRRATEQRYFNDMRDSWQQRARERALLRQQRVPALGRAGPTTDRLSPRLYRETRPLGHLPDRVENSADVNRHVFAPPRERVVPKSLQEFRDYRSHGR